MSDRETVEEEMARTSLLDSCQLPDPSSRHRVGNIKTFERFCRRVQGHGGHHASGWGRGYTEWAGR